jgi:hypothetical protein
MVHEILLKKRCKWKLITITKMKNRWNEKVEFQLSYDNRDFFFDDLSLSAVD